MSEDLELKQWISDDEEPSKTLTTEQKQQQQEQDILSDDQEEEEAVVANKSADAKQMKEDLMKEVEKRANANCTVNCCPILSIFFAETVAKSYLSFIFMF